MKIWDDLKQQYLFGGVVQKLIFWNIGLSMLFFILEGIFPTIYQVFLPWVGLSSDITSLIYRPWTLISYAFIHAGIIHLLFNVLVLHFVGRLFTTYFTQKQFLTVYFFGALIGGLFFAFGGLFLEIGTLLVGASAATIAPLIALAVYAPYVQIRLALIGNVKVWHIAVFLLVLDIIQLSASNTGGHLSHFGGAFSGFLYIKLLQSGLDLSNVIDSVFDLFKRNSQKKEKTPFKKVYVTKKNKDEKSKPRRLIKTESQAKIDEILEKISKSGYESLTKEEKDFLFHAGK